MQRPVPILASLLLIPAISACASSSTEYPSLAIRDVERERKGPNDYSNPPAPLTALPAETRQRLTDLRAEATSAHARFLSSQGRARTAVNAARGAAATSDRMSSARIALADLATHRSAMAIPLANIDIIYVDTFDSGVDTALVDSIRSEISALQDQQDSELARLRALLP